jgi:hypothetical protein
MSKVKSCKRSIENNFGVRYFLPTGSITNRVVKMGKMTKNKRIETFGKKLHGMMSSLCFSLPQNKIFNIEFKTLYKEIESNEIFDEYPNLTEFLKDVSKPIFDFLEAKYPEIKKKDVLLSILVELLNDPQTNNVKIIMEILEEIDNLLQNEFGQDFMNKIKSIQIEEASFDNDLNVFVHILTLFFMQIHYFDEQNYSFRYKFTTKDRFYTKIGYSIGP